MTGDDKIKKKQAKAEVKIAKAEAKAAKKSHKLEASVNLPSGVGIAVQKGEAGSELIVSGLRDEQLQRIVPQLSKEVLIAIAADRSSVRAGLMRFVREGIFQTIIKVIAGLIVGLILVKIGLG